jgi:hypothetical protein
LALTGHPPSQGSGLRCVWYCPGRPRHTIVADGSERTESSFKEGTFRIGRCEVGGAGIGSGSLARAPKPLQQVGPGGMEVVIVVEVKVLKDR